MGNGLALGEPIPSPIWPVGCQGPAGGAGPAGAGTACGWGPQRERSACRTLAPAGFVSATGGQGRLFCRDTSVTVISRDIGNAERVMVGGNSREGDSDG